MNSNIRLHKMSIYGLLVLIVTARGCLIIWKNICIIFTGLVIVNYSFPYTCKPLIKERALVSILLYVFTLYSLVVKLNIEKINQKSKKSKLMHNIIVYNRYLKPLSQLAPDHFTTFCDREFLDSHKLSHTLRELSHSLHAI